MELITPTAECNPDRLSYEKPFCLNGVPYSKVVPVSECCDDVVRWVNLETGEVFKEEPAGLVEGACAAEIPDSKVCYRGIAQTVYINKYATRFTRASEGATTAQYISRIELNYSPADTFCNLLDFAPNAIQYWTGSAYVDPAVLKSQLQSRGLLALVQGCEPKIDNWAVTIEGGQLVFRFWSTENDYTAQSFYFRVSFSPNANGSNYGTVLFGSSQDTFSVPETVEISIKSLNGAFYYYEDGVEVTDPARIAEIETLIGTLGPDDIVCCPDCVTESLNVLTDPQATPTATGNTNNLNSAFKDLNGDTWIVDINGDAVKAGSASVTCQAVMETETFTATAGQTTFALINAPSGDVRFSRNGAALADNAATVTGSTVTYVPAANNATALLAGDRIEISYLYNVCTGGAAPTIVDGSETKVTAGPGITVTGAGTTGNPYVISTPTLPNYAQTVYLNNTTPATSTIFDLANPPTTHNAALMADPSNLYVGSNDSLWSYDTSTATYSPIGSTLDNIHVRSSIPATPLTANTPRILTNFSNVHSSFPTAWNATTGTFTAPVAGFYAVAGELIAQHSTAWPTNANLQFDVMKNGALDTRWFDMAQTATSALLTASGSTTIYLAAGNTLNFRANTTAASSTLGNSAFSYITIDKLN